MKEIRLLSLLLVATLFIQNADATVTEILPHSSYYEGRSYYHVSTTTGGLAGRIDFAVYDTGTYPDEFVGAGGFEAPGQGQYIYAYQIFPDDISTDPFYYFAVLGIGDQAIDEEDGIGSQDDGQGGIEPDNAVFNPSVNPSIAFWEFDQDLLVGDEHSYFLVFTSDHSWVEGSYEIEPSEGPEPPVPNPEPTTIALLGLGSAMLLSKRRKSL